MDPERVRAYLQAACAGLGFDIGEVWWTSSEEGLSTVAAIHEENPADTSASDSLVPTKRKTKTRFVQLYTSKSFESRRADLVNPPEPSEPSNDDASGSIHRSSSTENLQKHVLSPRLVNAISETAQVVWANTKKQEGLTGRSDIRLQTAVGLPVALDANGNMCVVIMFSPNNIQSTDDAMDYLKSISHSATSPSIPTLLPVFDPGSGVKQLPFSENHEHHHTHEHDEFGEGVEARFVSIEETGTNEDDVVEVHSSHELTRAPKDTFGIPMLPTVAEIGSSSVLEDDPISNGDIFDEASYGVWATIMETLKDDAVDYHPSGAQPTPTIEGEKMPPMEPHMAESRKERLEEFCQAFLGMSVFDMADVWVPVETSSGLSSLRMVMSVLSTPNENLREFCHVSKQVVVEAWSGAVGRANSSGNPVWSANSNVFADPGRAPYFDKSKIQTVLTVPVFSDKSTQPSCVVACYSLVRSGSVPFVLRFVQQALRLLWEGLDNIEPHESVGTSGWQNVGPADLGEMAADVEMQQHFMTRKRSYSMSQSPPKEVQENSRPAPETAALASQLESVVLPNGETVIVPLQLSEDPSQDNLVAPSVAILAVQTYMSDAVKSMQQARPFDHLSISTNSEGTKRAHILGPISSQPKISPLQQPMALPSQIIPGDGVTNRASPPTMMPAAATTGAVHVPIAAKPPAPPFGAPPVFGVDGNSSMMPAPTYASNGMPPANVSLGTMPSMNGSIGYQGEQYCLSAAPALESNGSSSNGSMSLTKACRIQGCDEECVPHRPYCAKHSGNRLCEHPDCTKCAQGSTRFCIAHGGGRRCTFPGCDKGARDKFFCAAHGGGKRCRHEGCTKSAVGRSNLCTAHGGGRRCSVEGCNKSAQSSTKFCVKHGGGKKCAKEGCQKVARGRTHFCAAHGGGVRCKLEGCNRVAIGKNQLCRAHGGSSTRGTNPARNMAIPPQMPPSPDPVLSSSFMTGV